MSEGFLTNIETALLFYRFCQRYNILKVEDKVMVMRRITSKKKAKYLRDAEAFIKGKKVLNLKLKEPLRKQEGK